MNKSKNSTIGNLMNATNNISKTRESVIELSKALGENSKANNYIIEKIAVNSRNMFKNLHKVEKLITKTLLTIEDAIKELKMDRPQLDKELNAINKDFDELEKKEKGSNIVMTLTGMNGIKKSANEINEKYQKYSEKLSKYDDVFKKLAKNGIVIQQDNPLLKLAKEINGELENHKDLITKLKEVRVALKGLIEEQKYKREELMKNIETIINYELDPNMAKGYSKFLKEDVYKYPESLKTEFKKYELENNMSAIITLKYMTEVYDYDRDEITPKFLDNEEKVIDDRLNTLMEKSKKIDVKINDLKKDYKELKGKDFDSNEDKKSNKKMKKENKNKMKKVEEKSAKTFKKLSVEGKKLDIVKSLNSERKREKNFHENVKTEMFL